MQETEVDEMKVYSPGDRAAPSEKTAGESLTAWQDLARALAPFDEAGAQSPSFRTHCDAEPNPFWSGKMPPGEAPVRLGDPLRIAFENGNIPFGPTDLKDNYKWGLKPGDALKLSWDLLTLFDQLGSVLDPRQIQEQIDQLAAGQVNRSMVEEARGLMNYIWFDAYGEKASKPRQINLPNLDDLINRADGGSEKLMADWFALKAYLNGVDAHFYNTLSGALAARGRPESIDLEKALEMVFLESYGRALSKVNRVAGETQLEDLTPEGEELLAPFKDFYLRVLTHPLLAANGHAADFLDLLNSSVSKEIESVYRQAAEQASSMPFESLFTLTPDQKEKFERRIREHQSGVAEVPVSI